MHLGDEPANQRFRFPVAQQLQLCALASATSAHRRAGRLALRLAGLARSRRGTDNDQGLHAARQLRISRQASCATAATHSRRSRHLVRTRRPDPARRGSCECRRIQHLLRTLPAAQGPVAALGNVAAQRRRHRRTNEARLAAISKRPGSSTTNFSVFIRSMSRDTPHWLLWRATTCSSPTARACCSSTPASTGASAASRSCA